MSTSDDRQRDAAPTLFGLQHEQQSDADVRILANLEGRTPVKTAASPTARRRASKAVAALALVLVAVAGGLWWFSQPGESTVAEQPAQPAAAQRPAAEAPVLNAAAEPQQAATVVDVPPESALNAAGAGHDESALDQLGKLSAAAVTAATVGAAAYASTPKTPSIAAANKVNAKSDLSNKKNGSTGQANATSASSAKKPDGKLAKAPAESRKTTRKKSPGSLSADDPDADVLAALMAPPVPSSTASKARTRTTATRTQ